MKRVIEVEEYDDQWYEDENDLRRDDALADFNNGEVAALFRSLGEFAIGEIVMRKRVLQKGGFPLSMRVGFTDDFIKMLSADTYVDYQCYEKTDKGWEDDFTATDSSEYSAIQFSLVQAVNEYATVAASRSKQLGSSAVDIWAEVIDLTNFYSPRDGKVCVHESLTRDEATRVAELIENGTTRLRRDMLIANLPPFRKTAAKPKKRTAKR